MIDETGTIHLSKSPGRLCTVRIKAKISEVKRKVEQGNVSSRKLALELDVSRRSCRRIRREDLGCQPYLTHD